LDYLISEISLIRVDSDAPVLDFIYTFQREQIVREVIREINGVKEMGVDCFVDDWDMNERINIRELMFEHSQNGGIVILAKKSESIVGYIHASKTWPLIKLESCVCSAISAKTSRSISL
jgi:hypothetical protein